MNALAHHAATLPAKLLRRRVDNVAAQGRVCVGDGRGVLGYLESLHLPAALAGVTVSQRYGSGCGEEAAGPTGSVLVRLSSIMNL